MKEETSKKNGENPYFGEIFTFNCIPIDDKDYNVMMIEFWHKGKGDLGYTTVNLAQLALNKNLVGWFKLKGSKVRSGEVRIQVKLTKDMSPKAAQIYKEEIIDQCKRNGQKFSDPDFPAELSSVYIDINKPEVEISKQIVGWKRPNEIFENPKFFVNGVESGDVNQGNLGDCWFLGAVAILATREDLLLPLFVAKEEKYGFYQFKFYKNGEWKVVTIDDRLPVNGRKTKPFVFAHSQTDAEVWVPLIEKAYAKLHKSYQAIEMGTIAQALTDLTGESAQEFQFKEKEVKEQIEEGKFWKDIIQWLEVDKYLVGCSFQDDKGREQDMGMGIMSGHAYSVLEAHTVNSRGKSVKLLKIRNPWGSYEWKGPWSDNSSEWTSELKKQLNVKDSNDGIFWISWDDFIVQFNNIMLCRLLTDDVGEVWSKYEFKGNLVGKNTGGACSNETTWLFNDQYSLVVNHSTSIFVSIMQKDLRLDGVIKYINGIGLEIQKVDDVELPCLTAPHSNNIFSSTFNKGRDNSKFLKLDSGKYTLIPSTFMPEQETTYVLTAYSLKPIIFKRLFYDDITVSSSWSNHGGCHYNPNWNNNPQFLLQPPQDISKVHIKISLRQKSIDPVAASVYIIKKFQKGSKFTKEQIVFDQVPTAGRIIEQSLNISVSEGPFLLVPVTNKPGESGQFELTVFSKLGEIYKLTRLN